MSVNQDLSSSLRKTLYFVNHIFKVPASCILCLEDADFPVRLWLGCAIATANSSSQFYQQILDQDIVLWQEDSNLDKDLILSKNIHAAKLHIPRFYSGVAIGNEKKLGVLSIFDVQPHTSNPLQKTLLLYIKQQIESQLTLHSSLQFSIQRSSALEQQVQRWQSLNQMVTALESCRTLNESAQLFRQYMPEVFPGFSGSIFLLEKPNNENLYTFTFWGDVFTGEAPPVRSHQLVIGKRTLGYLNFQSHTQRESDWQAVSLSDSFFCKAFQLITYSLYNLILFKFSKPLESHRDSLTGLWNRKYILSAIDQLIRDTPKHESFGVILLEIDHLQQINEQFGIAAGDSVLQSFSVLLKNNTRSSDIVARYGGKEFILVLPNTSFDRILKRAERIRKSLEYVVMKYDRMAMGRVTVSVGVAIYPNNGATSAEILEVAEQLCYQAQRSGRNRVIYFGQC